MKFHFVLISELVFHKMSYFIMLIITLVSKPEFWSCNWTLLSLSGAVWDFIQCI